MKKNGRTDLVNRLARSNRLIIISTTAKMSVQNIYSTQISDSSTIAINGMDDLSVFVKARERGSFEDRPPGVGNSYCDTIGEGFRALVVSHEEDDEDDDPVNHAIHSTSHLGLNDWNIDRAVSSKNITVSSKCARQGPR